MPLKEGSSQKVISENIHELTHHGSRPRSHEQIVAIAMHQAHKSNYNDDHHATSHVDDQHPHQAHSQPHHRMENLPVSPGAKSYDHGAHAVRDPLPHHQHKHHIHDRRDKGVEHHPSTADGSLPGHVVNGGY